MIVVGREGARCPKRVTSARHRPPHQIDHLVMEQQEGRLKPGDHQVLIVAGVGDERPHVRPSGQVLEEAAALYLELDPLGGVVQLRVGNGAATVNRV